MRKLVFKMFIVFIFFFLFSFYIFPWESVGIKMPFSGKEYKLGLDLQGGIELDYKVDLDKVKEEDDYNSKKEKEIIEGLKSIIDKRIESLNINDSELNDASYGGEKHIIVQIPLKGNNSLENSKNIERAKEAIGKVVKIVFKEKRDGDFTEEDLKQREEIAQKALEELQNGEIFSVVSSKYKLNYEKVENGEVSDLTDLVEKTEDLDSSKSNIITLKTGEEGFLLFNNEDKNGEIEYIFISKTPSIRIDAKDSEGRILNDEYFVNSSVQFNTAYVPQVELVFNEQGAKIFGELSARLVGKQMAIFVGGEMLTDPVINEPIYGGKAVITGNYTTQEAKKLSQDINTGVVPAPIYLTSEKTIDSKIGANSLDKLIISGIVGILMIFVFMIFIYGLSGLVASFSLLLYAVIILFILKSTGTVLTLASIAGLVLSLGMAIDANILVFERIRNEIKDGKDFEEAVKTGFSKTWSAVWDSNLTGFIVALILFIFGINMIKGFGLILGIGIVVSFFTVMWLSRIFMLTLALKIKSTRLFIGQKKNN